MNNNTKKWYGFYSRTAEISGCPVSTYLDKWDQEIKVTGLSTTRDGLGYMWSDKQLVGDFTGLKPIKDTYRPHPDLYRYYSNFYYR